VGRPVRRVGTSVFLYRMEEKSPFPLPWGEGKAPWGYCVRGYLHHRGARRIYSQTIHNLSAPPFPTRDEKSGLR